MKSVLIATSKFGDVIPDYYKELGKLFKKQDYMLIYIFDNLAQNLPKSNDYQKFYTWPSSKPTKLQDFRFLFKLVARERPSICISNFESTNIISIVSFILKIEFRVTYVHTTRGQIILDSKRNRLQSYFWWLKRKIILSLNTHFFTNSIGSKNELVNSYKRLAEKISILPLQMRPSKLKYAKRLDREFCIVIVGRLHPSKGHKDLLQQFSKCLFNFPNLILKIVGDGHLKKRVEKSCKKIEN